MTAHTKHYEVHSFFCGFVFAKFTHKQQTAVNKQLSIKKASRQREQNTHRLSNLIF